MDEINQVTAKTGCRKKWVSHEQINALFGNVSNTKLAEYRRERKITFAKHPFNRYYIYSLEEIEALIQGTMVEKKITHQ